MVIGHKKQLDLLERLIKTNRVPHAFLFSGPAHIGKYLIAHLFFWRVVSERATWEPFFKEENKLSKTFLSGVHPDILLIRKEKDKKKISIDQVHVLKKFIGLSRQELSHKGVIIDQAHLLSRSAYNSLLKTFEEPPKKTVILLVSEQPGLLPKTIRSRAFNVRFRRVPNTTLKEGLKKHSVKIKEDDLGWIAGRPGLALQYKKEQKEGHAALLREQFYSFLSSLPKSTIQDLFKEAEHIANREETTIPLEAWILAVYHTAKERGGKRNSTLLQQAQKLVQLHTNITTTNVNQRLHIEEALLRMHN